ncbi:MAG: signal recognition particle-docking protein FtsY [Oceanospirillaceae bacterium]|nr:signal recognition particle-docking protein FtsY [Oceanospirillaceae bacterium]
MLGIYFYIRGDKDSGVEAGQTAKAQKKHAAKTDKPAAVKQTSAEPAAAAKTAESKTTESGEAEPTIEQPAAAAAAALELEPKPEPETKPEPELETKPEPEAKPEPEPEPEPEPVAAAAPPVAADSAEKPRSMLARIRAGLSRTKSNLGEKLGNLFLGAKEIDDELLEDIETLLLTADVGMEATTEIIKRLTDRVERNQLSDPAALQQALQEELASLLHEVEQPLDVSMAKEKRPYVILMVGVNGVGKTTTIGKLAKRYQAEGKSVMLAAGDTFRAAAVEQLQVWGERNAVPVVAQHTGADSASVLYDALQSAKARDVDVLIADTAGRLQNKDNLMQELQKVVRVMQKLDPEAPHEVMLVLDAGTGQNALSQARIFREAVGVSGITLTKLDGTAKGGIIFAIAKQLGLPIRYIGVGEQAEDLRPFAADDFVKALFD